MTKLYTAEDCDRMTIDEVWDLHRRYVNPSQVDIYTKFSFGRDLFTHAEGMYLHTADGRRILDFSGGIGVLNHGHNHPRILLARRAYQEKKRMEVHKIVFSPYLVALAHNVAQLLPGDLNKSFFPNSGAEAVEGAIKLAFKAHQPRREYILHADVAFHGKLIGSGTISGLPYPESDFPRMSNTAAFRFGDLESVRQRVAEFRRPDGSSNVYAIIIEPYSASRATACGRDFLYGLRDLCDREDIVLIFDEVYMGWGKSGTLFYFMRHEGLLPDILTMSKSFGGGKSSISAYSARDSVFMRAYGSENTALLHTSTYNGFGEECATAIEAIRVIIEDDYPAKARAIHEYLFPKLAALKEKYPAAIKEIRGVGAWNTIILNSPFAAVERILKSFPVGPLKNRSAYIDKITAAAVADALYEKHNILPMIVENRELVMLGAGPSIIAEREHLDCFVDSLDEILDKGLAGRVAGFCGRVLRQIVIPRQ